MDWFQELTGFPEIDRKTVRDQLFVDDGALCSRLTDHRFRIGAFSHPAVSELRAHPITPGGGLSLSEVVADVQDLHLHPENAGATFQVASQFNLLEMVGPDVTPDDGVTRYQHDHTQGPACAIACGASTIYRNYFVPVADGTGQTTSRQLDCLARLAEALDPDPRQYWTMQNGYALLTSSGLANLNALLRRAGPAGRFDLMGLVEVGLHVDADVTLRHTCRTSNQMVTQVYCSAMPVAYGAGSASSWEMISRLVLDAAYEATLRLAAQNAARTGNHRVFLTFLGGGAFGNPADWIADAVLRALTLVRDTDLDVRLVSYGRSSDLAQSVLQRWRAD